MALALFMAVRVDVPVRTALVVGTGVMVPLVL
jgi:hypothetical protein